MDNSILKMLRDNDISVMRIAEHFKVNRSAVYQSIDGGGSRKIRVHIATLLNIKPSNLWADSDVKQLYLDDVLFIFGTDSGDVA